VLTPRLAADEPLRLEVQDFVDSIRGKSEPRSSAAIGLAVVAMIEAAEKSLEYNSAPVPLDEELDVRRHVPDRRRSVAGMPVVRGDSS
jgi:hypothetical protein